MSEQEVRETIGFLKIEDGPIWLDYEKLELVQNNFGVDVLHDKPLVVRRTDVFNLVGKVMPLIEQEFKQQLGFVTSIIVRELEHQRIPGEVVLWYELYRLRWDYKLVCKAYRRREASKGDDCTSVGDCCGSGGIPDRRD